MECTSNSWREQQGNCFMSIFKSLHIGSFPDDGLKAVMKVIANYSSKSFGKVHDPYIRCSSNTWIGLLAVIELPFLHDVTYTSILQKLSNVNWKTHKSSSYCHQHGKSQIPHCLFLRCCFSRMLAVTKYLIHKNLHSPIVFGSSQSWVHLVIFVYPRWCTRWLRRLHEVSVGCRDFHSRLGYGDPLVFGCVEPREAQIVAPVEIRVLAVGEPPAALVVSCAVRVADVSVWVLCAELHPILQKGKHLNWVVTVVNGQGKDWMFDLLCDLETEEAQKEGVLRKTLGCPWLHEASLGLF